MKMTIVFLFLLPIGAMADRSGSEHCWNCTPDQLTQLATLNERMFDTFSPKATFSREMLADFCDSLNKKVRTRKFFMRKWGIRSDEEMKALYESSFCSITNPTRGFSRVTSKRESIPLSANYLASIGVDPNLPDGNGMTMLDYLHHLVIEGSQTHMAKFQKFSEMLIQAYLDVGTSVDKLPKLGCNLRKTNKCKELYRIEGGKIKWIHMDNWITRKEWQEGYEAWGDEHEEFLDRTQTRLEQRLMRLNPNWNNRS